MCGIVGIVGKSNVNQALYDALTVLQHRGQDAAGIVTCHDDKLYLRKDNGLVLSGVSADTACGGIRPTGPGNAGQLPRTFPQALSEARELDKNPVGG